MFPLISKSSELRILVIVSLSNFWPVILSILLYLRWISFLSNFKLSSIKISDILASAFICFIKIDALFNAYNTLSGSTPLSYLYEASVNSWCLLDDFLMGIELKMADSKNKLVVEFETPDSWPPYIPAKQSGVLFEQIIKSSLSKLIMFSSRVLNLVFDFNDFTFIFSILSKSKAWRGCPISCITKFVMSTILLIGFNPIDFNLFCNSLDDGPTLIFFIITPE